jgi:hypothetical protein
MAPHGTHHPASDGFFVQAGAAGSTPRTQRKKMTQRPLVSASFRFLRVLRVIFPLPRENGSQTALGGATGPPVSRSFSSTTTIGRRLRK